VDSISLLKEKMVVPFGGVRVGKLDGTKIVPHMIFGLQGSFGHRLDPSNLQSTFGKFLASREAKKAEAELRRREFILVKNRNGKPEKVFTDQARVRKL
jgi:hypothetical protein